MMTVTRRGVVTRDQALSSTSHTVTGFIPYSNTTQRYEPLRPQRYGGETEICDFTGVTIQIPERGLDSALSAGL